MKSITLSLFSLVFRLKKEAIQYGNKSMKQHVSCPVSDQLDFTSEFMYYICQIQQVIFMSANFIFNSL